MILVQYGHNLEYFFFYLKLVESKSLELPKVHCTCPKGLNIDFLFSIMSMDAEGGLGGGPDV